MPIYFGDLHAHCNMSYGFGSQENAIMNAKQQLDFVALTGHAMWPDIVSENEDTKALIDFHLKGFKKLLENWDEVLRCNNEHNKDGEFVTFNCYEMHSCYYGDHHFISKSNKMPILYLDSPKEIIKKLGNENALAIMHHPGYTPGYRGGNYRELDLSTTPLVEIYSKHGLSIRDDAIFEYLHDMGPRDSRGTAHNGLNMGKIFGFTGSTDHHAGYPGSYGDGKVGVYAKEKTRDSIFKALKERKTYAINKDKIICDFRINDKIMGSCVNRSKNNKIYTNIEGLTPFDKVTIYKNQKPYRIIIPSFNKAESKGTYIIRIETGWGNSSRGYFFKCISKIEDGEILEVIPCFKGLNILSPTMVKGDLDQNINEQKNRIVNQSKSQVNWECYSTKNQTTLHSSTNSIVLKINGKKSTKIILEVNGCKIETSIETLLNGSISKHLKPYNSEGVLIHRAYSSNQCRFEFDMMDDISETECDIYYLEARQNNLSFAWASPIFLL